MTQSRQISPERRGLYTAGIAVTILGALVFGSVFVSFAFFAGNLGNGPQAANEQFPGFFKSFILRGIIGMGLLMAGTAMRNVAARGVAGSGFVLDPQQARQDIEPWARMSGGVIKDALDETGIDLNSIGGKPGSEGDFADRLRKLHALYTDGIISEEEYLREKQEILEKN